MLKGFDGFDFYAPGIPSTSSPPYANVNARSNNFIQYQMPEEGENFMARPGRNNYGGCYARAGFVDGGFAVSFADFNQIAFIGAAITVPGVSPGGYDRTVVAFFDQRQPSGQWTFAFNFDKTISVYRGGLGLLNTPTVGVLLYTSPPIDFPFSPYDGSNPEFFYLEVGMKIDSVAGWIDIRINGQTVIKLENINNQTSSFNTFDSMGIVYEGFNSFLVGYVDDFYYCDSIPGPDPILTMDTFLGDSRVLTQYAIADVHTDFTPTAPKNFLSVNEPACDLDASFNSSNVAGNFDTFNFGEVQKVVDLAFGINITGNWRKDDAGLKEFQYLLRSGLATFAGPVHSLPDTTYAIFSDMFQVNPATGRSWDLTALNGFSAGYRLVF